MAKAAEKADDDGSGKRKERGNMRGGRKAEPSGRKQAAEDEEDRAEGTRSPHQGEIVAEKQGKETAAPSGNAPEPVPKKQKVVVSFGDED